MTLEEIRKDIDRIDRQLLDLFRQRMDCAKQVAKIKAEQNLPVLNPAREAEILDRVEQEAGEFGGAARVIFSTLMEVSRACQHELIQDGGPVRELFSKAAHTLPTGGRVACPGVADSHSHHAASVFFPGQDPVFCPEFRDVFRAVAQDEVEWGVVPVENSTAGSVVEVYDLMLQYHFYLAGAIELPIGHCLAARPGVELEDIKTVYSHPQALAQCSAFIRSRRLKPIEFSNTAAAAKMVSQSMERGIAAVCSEQAARRFGLQILAQNIQNDKTNTTRFVLFSKKLIIPPQADKISLCFTLPHLTGSLHEVLARFAAHQLNLTKIESRPIPGKRFEYHFYLDFTGNVADNSTAGLLYALSEELPGFFFLGNYQEKLCGQ